MNAHHHACPLCGSSGQFTSVAGPDKRDYRLCGKCFLVSVAPAHFPQAEKEKARYELHNNNIEDKGYVSYLLQAVEPALKFVEAGAECLDYGCGPNPVLSFLLNDRGYYCDSYDPFFFPQLDASKKYDLIFSTECFEHFFHPKEEIQKLKSLLKKGGCLTVMTEMWQTEEIFKIWHYARDFTHVCFYSPRTFDYICEKFGFRKAYSDGKKVIIMIKTVNKGTREKLTTETAESKEKKKQEVRTKY